MKRWLTIALLAAGTVQAREEPRDQPIVRVDTEPESVAVGEAVRMRVTVLVPTWFARPPEYPDFELANAITRLPADSSFPTSERVGGTTWSGIVRNYRVYPLAGASYRMAGETIRVTYADPGADAIERNVPVPEIEFRATVPAGAEGLDPYIAGRSLTLAMEVEGSVAALEAGDAVVLRYTAELDGLPAIFLPSLAPPLDLAGVSVYADQPEVEDGPPARRSEQLTLVFDAGGEYAVPAVELGYWNTGTRSVETASADGLSLPVAGPPPAPPETAAAPGSSGWRAVVAILTAAAVIGLLSVAVARRALPTLRRAFANAARRRRESEAHAFCELQTALRAGRSQKACEWLLEWTSRLEPPIDSRDLAARYGDEDLRATLEDWRGKLFGGRSRDASLRAVAAGLAAARKRYRERSSTTAPRRLPPLNPA